MMFIYKLVLTVVGVALFALQDRARGRVTVAACVCGALTFTCNEMFNRIFGTGFVCYLLSALITCIFSEICARVMKVPTTVILLPAVIPLVPGALLYNSVRGLMTHDGEWYLKYGREALNATAGIAVAAVTASAAARVATFLTVKVSKKANRQLETQ